MALHGTARAPAAPRQRGAQARSLGRGRMAMSPYGAACSRSTYARDLSTSSSKNQRQASARGLPPAIPAKLSSSVARAAPPPADRRRFFLPGGPPAKLSYTRRKPH